LNESALKPKKNRNISFWYYFLASLLVADSLFWKEWVYRNGAEVALEMIMVSKLTGLAIAFSVTLAIILQFHHVVQLTLLGIVPHNVTKTPPPASLRLREKRRPADATWNGLDLTYVNIPPTTPMVHCVGENFDNSNRSWLFRSCEYSVFCYDVQQEDFVIFRPEQLVLPNKWWSSTLSSRLDVAAGSQTKTLFGKPGVGKFAPRVVNGAPPSGYYRLANRTMLPFYRHPTSYRNPGHLQWDDFLPLYVLLDIFDRTDDSLVLIQMQRPQDEEPPFDLFTKFLPMMGANTNYITKKDSSLQFLGGVPKWKTTDDNEAHVICADTALVGDGLFSDHGKEHWHGQSYTDRKNPYNIGKGGTFRRFRNWILKHSLNMSPNTERRGRIDPETMDRVTAPLGQTSTDQSTGIPFKIIVSQSSSTKGSRSNLTFTEHITALRETLGSAVEVLPVQLPELSLRDQIELVVDATVYISAAGGSTATAMFLPKGAHLILFYHPVQYLDYDFWNNFPHLNVHWIGLWKETKNNNGATVTKMKHSHPQHFAEFVMQLIMESEVQREPLEIAINSVQKED